MIDYKKLKVGEVLSETSYYVIGKVNTNSIEATNNLGNTVELSKIYVEQILASADQFTKEEKLSQTEIINIIMANPRTACSIYFKKQDKEKTKKAYNEEKAKKIEQIKNAKVSEVEALLSDLIDNPILNVIPGEMRLIKGYHNGNQDERGRVQFIDMEDNNIVKGVDTRTLVYIIVNNVKYSVK